MKNTLNKILFISYYLLPIFHLYAQPNIDRKRDMITVTGYESRNHNICACTGSTFTDFNYCPPRQTYKYTNIDFNWTTASICDTSGRLLFYTNGYTIEDSTYQTMLNGDSLSVPDYRYPDGSYTIQASIILPMGTTDKYVVFHQYAPRSFLRLPGSNIDRQFFPNTMFSIVDMNLNNHKGAVTLKNKIISTDSAYTTFSEATRHANGRDWWVLRINKNMNKYKRLLISPYGIDSLLPVLHLPYVSNDSSLYNAFDSKYSPDGTKFAHRGMNIWLYDLDRCTGVLTNRRIVYNQPEGYSSIVFSPNSRYLYSTRNTLITQYDTEAADIQASGIVVAQWDSTIVNVNGFESNTMFFQGWNGPDGKIYVNGPGGNQIWHVIENPNERGVACNVQLHSIHLPTWYFGTTPNFPNFRLGALRGSPCDTLGIEEGAEDVCAPYSPTPTLPRGEGDAQMRIYPNPASNSCVLAVSDNLLSSTYTIIDATGKLIQSNIINATQQNIDIQSISAGVYYIKILGAMYDVQPIKLVIIK